MRAIAIVLSLILLCGCTRGKKKAPEGAAKTPAGETSANEAAADGKAKGGEGLDPAWLAGDLPKTLLEGTPKRGGEVTVQIWSEPPSLNSLRHSDWIASHVANHQIYEALVAMDPYDAPAHPIVGELAERWDVSDDKRVYTFHLHEGVTWHDGKPFGSKDVVATFDKILDEDTLSVHTRSYFELLDKHEAVDAHTVRFTWKKPYFMTLDAFEMVPIMPAHVLEKMSATEFNEAATNPLNRRPVGTGPFKFVEWEASQKIVLARNDAYWGKKAHLDRVVFRIVRDDTVRKQMAQRLDVDVWTRPSDDDWVKMKDERVFVEKFNRSLIYDHSYAWIGWNQAAKPFFADKRVRRALGQLVNRKRIAETMFFGLRKPTECHFYWASRECEGLEQFPYDRKAAEQLLTEAGWVDSDGDGIRDKDGVPFRFTFMVPASSVNSAKMGTKMKEDYHRAGIEMDIQKVEWTVFTKRLRKHEFDACTLMWGSSGPRADPVQIWHSNALEGGSNYISFRSDRADQLIEQAAVEFDVDKRTELYREFGRLLKDEQPYTMLFVSPRKALLHKRIRGARESLMWWRFRDWWVDGER